MIGNRIIFTEYDKEYNRIEVEGLVVDAFTEISGRVTGDHFLGFGDVHGRTESKRKYKVEYFPAWDKSKTNKRYTDIFDWQLVKVIQFAGEIIVNIPEKFRSS